MNAPSHPGQEPSVPQRPTPTIGDASSARQRAADPTGWSLGEQVQDALAQVVTSRRDIRRYRNEDVPDELLTRVLEAGHAAPSVGHSQPWRFIVVRSQATRDRAAHLADAARIKQARSMVTDRANRLLDLKLEGLREAPLGIVVACDRRTPASGVLGRATFEDTDLWSCACAIQNMWLTARAYGLGMGWVTLFEPDDLAQLLNLPDGVETLGWMCLGWPDERPPEPGLQRAAWSTKLPLADVVLQERWPDEAAPSAPVSHLRAPQPAQLVGATDDADSLLAPPEALGVLDRVVNRIIAASGPDVSTGTLILAGADHPVSAHGVSAYDVSVTRDVMERAQFGDSLGVAHARAGGLQYEVVDAGVGLEKHPTRGDLITRDALPQTELDELIERGRDLGRAAAARGLVALGEVGVGNTTVASALTAALLGQPSEACVGLGSGSDADMLARKRHVVDGAVARLGTLSSDGPGARRALQAVGGGDIALLTGVCLGAAAEKTPIILDGLATSVAALAAVRMEPAVQAFLVAGQQSREVAHPLVLSELGLEPLLALRVRSGEGVGAVLAAGLLLRTLEARRTTVRTNG